MLLRQGIGGAVAEVEPGLVEALAPAEIVSSRSAGALLGEGNDLEGESVFEGLA